MEQPPSLAAFFIFNPTLGDEETEGQKNLFFYPDIEANRQKDYIGLTEGIINFTRDFSPDAPCDALRCEKTRHSFYECEKDFWMILIMNNPCIYKDRNRSSPVYLEDEIGDSSLKAIVKRTYATYRMFNGTMTELVRQHSNHHLRGKLQKFMKFFIPTIDFKNVRFSMDIRGFNFMPVTRPTFLTIQYIISMISSTFPFVISCSVAYNKKLIWSGLEQEDMFFLYLLDQKNMEQLYEYLASNSDDRKSDTVQDSKQTEKSSWTIVQKDVGFLTGPASGPLIKNAPLISLQTYNWEKKRLAVFKSGKFSIFMIMEDVKETANKSVYETLQSSIQGEVQKLELSLSRQVQQVNRPPSSHRFLYFNALNLALVSTINSESRSIGKDTIKLIRKIHEDFQINPWKGYDKNFHEKKMMNGSKTLVQDNQASQSTNTSLRGKNEEKINDTETSGDTKDKTIETESKRQSNSLSEKSSEMKEKGESSYEEKSKTKSKLSGQNKNMKDIPDGSPVHVAIKTKSDGWLVASKATQTQREFFVLIEDKNGNLSSIQEEVNRLARSYFSKIFMH